MEGGIEGVHEFAAVDQHGKVGTGAGARVELPLTLPGDGREDDDAGSPLDHFHTLVGGTVGRSGDHDIVEASAIEDRFAECRECEPPRALDLADQRVAQGGIGGDDPDRLRIHRDKCRSGSGSARWPNGTGMRGSMGREMQAQVIGS